MSSLLRLCPIIEDEDIVFPVDVFAQDLVAALKKEIQLQRAMDTLKDVGPHTLELWKVCIPNTWQHEVTGLLIIYQPRDINAIVIKPVNTLLARIRSMGASLSEFAEKLDPIDSLSEIFPTQPSMDRIHIIVKFKGM